MHETTGGVTHSHFSVLSKNGGGTSCPALCCTRRNFQMITTRYSRGLSCSTPYGSGNSEAKESLHTVLHMALEWIFEEINTIPRQNVKEPLRTHVQYCITFNMPPSNASYSSWNHHKMDVGLAPYCPSQWYNDPFCEDHQYRSTITNGRSQGILRFMRSPDFSAPWLLFSHTESDSRSPDDACVRNVRSDPL